MRPTVKTPLSLLTLALVSAIAHADEPSSVTLENVTVSGTAVPTRVTRTQLDRETATDMKQVMKDQIGMDVGGGNGVAQYYSIRGIGEDKINLNVDNTSQSTKIFHHQSRFMLDPSLVKSINVEKGTGSASAGIGATAGTIRVTTVDAKDLLVDGKPFGFKLGAGASSNKGWNTNAAAYTHINGFDALLAGNILRNSDYKDGGGTTNAGSRLDQHSVLAKIGYDFNEDHGLRLSYRQEYQKGRRTDKAEFMPAENPIPADGTAQRENSLNLAYKGRNIGFIDKADANIFQIKTDDYKPPKRTSLNTSEALEHSEITALGGNVDLSSRLADKHTLKYGVNLRRETSKPSDKGSWLQILGLYDRDDEKKTDYGVYVEGIWDLAPLTLTTGLRYDYFKFNAASRQSASDGSINPSLGLIWDVTPNFALIGTLNQASRSPRLNEALLANERAGAAADLDGNLKAETARRAEVGFKWRNSNFDISGSVFHQNIKDLINYEWASISNANGTINSRGRIYNNGKLKTQGYELDAAYRYGGLTARAGVSYVKPKISGDAFPYEDYESSYYFWNTGRQWLTSLSYRFANPKLEIGWRGRYAESTNYTSNSRAPYNSGKKPGYGVHDIFANWQPTGKENLNVNFAVNNVGDKKYRTHGQRFSDAQNRVSYYERGREYAFGLNYRF